MNVPFYNGDFDSATQDGPIDPDVDAINRAQIWRQPMIQRASLWTPRPIDSAGPLGGFLVEETTPSAFGADLIKWHRVFAEVPLTHKEPVGWTHTYQFITDDLVEISIGTVATMVHEYFHVADSTTITIIRASKYVKFGSDIKYIGDLPADTGPIVAADSTLDRWMGKGNIWCRKTPYVARRSLLSFTLP
jgi:hypothetical protein